MVRQNTALGVGEHVRLTPGGLVYVVIRTNPCAAYLRGGEMRTVTVMDRKTGEARTFEAEATRILAVSPRAFVERVS